ncbi:MAG TPA: DUF6776 family protein [Steroidobacteraceae bacterium]|jgi:hypothetical protein|nr:DUF6776 family protein [Steroidobacteraceae bacterium]
MADSFGKLVVRAYAPKRRAVLWTLAALVIVGILYTVFELGRYEAGFRVVDSVRGALSASRRIRSLEAENANQRRQLEAAETARRVDREGYAHVAQSLGDMQSQIARLNQDLSFYRGLVQPESLIHVKVQQMQIIPDGPPGQYHLKFVLMQTGKADKEVVGSAAVTIDGLLQGKPLSLTYAQVSPGHRVSLAYSLKYFQEYNEPIEMPAGFEPTRVGVEIRSGRDTSHSSRQAFVWKAQGMSVETEANGDIPGKGEADVQTETE